MPTCTGSAAPAAPAAAAPGSASSSPINTASWGASPATSVCPTSSGSSLCGTHRTAGLTLLPPRDPRRGARSDMRSEIELARSRQVRTGELAAAARYARERLVIYRARTDGPKVTSPARIRELEQASELAELRLELAQSVGDRDSSDAESSPEGAGFRGETDDGVEFQ